MRKLASIREISEIKVHPNADALELAIIDGWQCIVRKGEFVAGDLVVYFETDSVLPIRDEFEFLRKSCYVKKDWIEGFRLKTIKLRGEISSGLLLKVEDIFDIVELVEVGQDVTELLGVVKWDPPVPTCLAGQAKGYFPSFIPKTDQERAQNLVTVIADAVINQDEFEVTIKLDGSSCTMYHNNGDTGVCSRNIELKVNEENAENTFVRAFHETGLANALLDIGKNIAIQGELMGPGIQGNREGFTHTKFFVFDIYDIDSQVYLTPKERKEFFIDVLLPLGVKIYHVPVLASTAKLKGDLGITNIEQLLKFAEGPSINNPVREGLVFKRSDGGFSFKAISNDFLLGEK